MSADLALQKAIRARLVASEAVTQIVPAGSILDINQRPAPVPSIIIGEGQIVDGDDIMRMQVRVYATLHVWMKENGLIGSKKAAWAVRKAIQSTRLYLGDDFHAVDAHVTDARFLRDPGGELSHGVVTIAAYVQDLVA